MNEILKKSEEKGTLTWKYKEIRSCSYCDKKYDYYTYPRSGRNHSKGDKNYNKPKYYRGIAFNEGFVTIQGHGDMCSECAIKHDVIHKLIDYVLDNDLKIEIQKNDYKMSKYLKDDIRICYECENEMQESKMSKRSTLMGDSSYPAGCPKCGAESLPFGRSHKTTNKFAVIENPMFEYKHEIELIKQNVKEYNQTHDTDIIKFGETWNKPNQYFVYIEKTNSPSLFTIYPLQRRFRYEWNYSSFPEQTKLIEDILLGFNYSK